MKHLTFLALLLLSFSCQETETSEEQEQTIIPEKNVHLLHDVKCLNEDGSVNAVIEIPTGTNEKWEINKTTGQAEWTEENGKPRVVNYLSYPGNYGMVPQTHLSKEMGGDGDPLDVLVLGPAVERGTILKCDIIGVLLLRDRGEQEDKLLAIGENSTLQGVQSIREMDSVYVGITSMIESWFTNYKGPGKMESLGWGESDTANFILQAAIDGYQKPITE